MRALAAAGRVGHLGTVGADGTPHVVAVCFALSDETVFSAVDNKPKRSPQLRRLANVRATGRACLLVDEYVEDWSRLWWVRMDGAARVVEHPGEASAALSLLAEKYEQYAATAPPGPVLALDVERWSGWSAA